MAVLDLRNKLAVLTDVVKYDASSAPSASSGTSKLDSVGGKGVGSTEGVPRFAPTVRPSYLLRLQDEASRRAERALFVEDLMRVRSLL